LLVTELGFLNHPALWNGHRKLPEKWGLKLIAGDFAAWKEVQRRSAQIRAAIFYPSDKRDKRNNDFILCINKYTPLALTRIQDADVRANSFKLESICSSVGLQFGYTTERPILLPLKPESCSFGAVKTFVEQLERLKRQVGCSIRELGEIPRFG
jgi:hypothetical protein